MTQTHDTPATAAERLAPDQHAALSLLLRQGQSYGEVAALLGISEQAVHDRAHAALAVLAPALARELSAERRSQVGDYLLGQQPAPASASTRSYLEGSPAARDWASALTAQLQPLAGRPLPPIPPGSGHAPPPHGQQPQMRRPSAGEPPAPGVAAGAAAQARAVLPSSRLGGGLLLGAIVAAIVIAVVLLSGGGSHKSPGASAARSTGSTPAASPSHAGSAGTTGSGGATGSGAKTVEDKRIELTSTNPASNAIGIAEVLSEGSTYAFYLAAEHLPPSKGFFYGVWLYNSPTSFEALSASPPVGSDGHLQGGALLPSNAGAYHTMIITRETSTRPSHPGPVVLSGAFALH